MGATLYGMTLHGCYAIRDDTAIPALHGMTLPYLHGCWPEGNHSIHMGVAWDVHFARLHFEYVSRTLDLLHSGSLNQYAHITRNLKIDVQNMVRGD